MKDSGVAYDAKERGLFGGIKIDEPLSDRFTPDTEQLVWWAEFNKSFEHWDGPDLTADWYNPEGQMVASIEVDAERCKLAKAVIRQERFMPGMWHVDVNCGDEKMVDHHRFGVGYPPLVPPDVQVVGGPAQKSENRMIEAP